MMYNRIKIFEKTGGTMTANNLSSATTGRMAITTGFVYILAAVLLILFFTVGQPFGTLNDIFNGLAGISSGILAWMLYTEHSAASPSLFRVGIVLAWIGVISVVIGSALVISQITGWVLAGLYSSAGSALIGFWVLAFNYSMMKNDLLNRNLNTWGLVAGALMVTGLFVLPGIFSGFDSETTVPWYLYVAGLGALGGIIYIIWCIRLGRALLRK